MNAPLEQVQLLDPNDVILWQNIRKDIGDISELVESVRTRGVLTPTVGRRRPDGRVELIVGQRRRAACIELELELPVIVREFDDEAAIDLQLVENLDREDLPPLDEAAAYSAKLERGLSVRQIADGIGRGPGYVAKRLKLLDLGKDVRKALAAGDISVTVAEMIGRVPPKLQAEALKAVSADEYAGKAMTAAEATAELQEKFMLRLADAPFDRADPDLVPKAGACTVCPHRTGNQAELFSDVKSADLCTLPDCFKSKNAAHAAKAIAAAKADGRPILSASEAKAFFKDSWSTKAFERLDAEHYVSPGSTKKTSVKRILEKAGSKAEVSVTVDPNTGALVEVVPKAAYDAAVRKLTGKPKHSGSRSSKPTASEKKAREKAKAQAEAKELVDTRVLAAIGAGKLSPADTLRLVLPFLDSGAGELGAVLGRRGVKLGKGYWRKLQRDALRDLIDGYSDKQVAGLFAEIVVAGELDVYSTAADEKEVAALCKALGVDRLAIEKAVILELAAKVAEPAAAKKQPKKAAKPKSAKPAKKAAKKAPRRKK